MKKLSITGLDELLSAISQAESLYLPVSDGTGAAAYEKWTPGAKYCPTLNTVRSAKDFFFPQTENLVEFKMKGQQIDIIDHRRETEDFVVFGVRACDAKSFDILDRVFLSDPVDSYYENRRSHGVIMTMSCSRPAETCFCSAFGIDAADPAGDVSCWMDDKNLYLRANTQKGEALLNRVDFLLESADEDAVIACQEKTRTILDRLPLAGLSTQAFGGDQLENLFNHPKWAQLSQSCLGCGSCTFVCPTCQCYDIRDFDTGHGVKRFRCWDSCMYSDFTKMAGGQPRLTQLERFRQRFMHKLVYFPENNDGVFGCVGCGRCLRRCPISMNIVKVMKALGGEK